MHKKIGREFLHRCHFYVLILLPLIQLHQQIAHRQQNTRYPDDMDAIPNGKVPANPGADREHEDDAKVVHGLTQLPRLMLTEVDGKRICTASEVADAHRTCIRETTDFAEGLYLHCTG